MAMIFSCTVETWWARHQYHVLRLVVWHEMKRKEGCRYRRCHKYIFISYLFSIFSYLLLYSCHCLCYYAYAIYSYLILYTSSLFYTTDQTLFIHYLFIAFSKVWSDIPSFIIPSYFLSFSCFYFILLSSSFP